MDERCHYLYAMTWANCSAAGFGPGVDPRFPVELAPCGQIAGLASLVGLDRFDIGKLQAGSTDLRWLSEVAVRHNQVIEQLAQQWPVLPLRMGTLFESQASLRAKLAQHEVQVADFLRQLGDRQEWAVKVYLDEPCAEVHHRVAEESPLASGEGQGEGVSDRRGGSAHNISSPAPLTLALSQSEREGTATRSSPPRSSASSSFPRSSVGTQYLAAKRLGAQHRQEAQAAARRALPILEARLQTLADAWQRLRPLPAALTGRAEKMVYNGALLLRRSRRQVFATACGNFRRQLAAEGLILELSGPWPPYHFCPALQP